MACIMCSGKKEVNLHMILLGVRLQFLHPKLNKKYYTYRIRSYIWNYISNRSTLIRMCKYSFPYAFEKKNRVVLHVSKAIQKVLKNVRWISTFKNSNLTWLTQWRLSRVLSLTILHCLSPAMNLQCPWSRQIHRSNCFMQCWYQQYHCWPSI